MHKLERVADVMSDIADAVRAAQPPPIAASPGRSLQPITSGKDFAHAANVASALMPVSMYLVLCCP